MSNCDTLPLDLQSRTQSLYPATSLEEVFSSSPQTALRVNTLKTTPAALSTQLESRGLRIEPVSWYSDAFVLIAGGQRALMDTPEYKNGECYIQNLSSMIPALILHPLPGERVLDLTAAPGSKTTQLAALMQNHGEILANDLSRARVFRLRANLEQLGVTIAQTTTMPGEILWKKYPEHFDKTLVDAPCTMEGRIKCAEPESYADWSLKKVKSLSRRQQFLLRSAVSATKPGGVIVYSTCTLAPEENEGVIDWLLEKEGDAIAIEACELPELHLEPGITEWEGTTYHPEVAKSARVRPTHQFEGFFVAKIRKLRPTVVPQLPQKHGAHPRAKSRLR